MYACGCPGEVGKRDMFSIVIICITDLLKSMSIIINIYAFDVVLMLFLQAVLY